MTRDISSRDARVKLVQVQERRRFFSRSDLSETDLRLLPQVRLIRFFEAQTREQKRESIKPIPFTRCLESLRARVTIWDAEADGTRVSTTNSRFADLNAEGVSRALWET